MIVTLTQSLAKIKKTVNTNVNFSFLLKKKKNIVYFNPFILRANLLFF